MQSYHLGLVNELGGCNNEAAALQRDLYTEIPLYIYIIIVYIC